MLVIHQRQYHEKSKKCDKIRALSFPIYLWKYGVRHTIYLLNKRFTQQY